MFVFRAFRLSISGTFVALELAATAVAVVLVPGWWVWLGWALFSHPATTAAGTLASGGGGGQQGVRTATSLAAAVRRPRVGIEDNGDGQLTFGPPAAASSAAVGGARSGAA